MLIWASSSLIVKTRQEHLEIAHFGVTDAHLPRCGVVAGSLFDIAVHYPRHRVRGSNLCICRKWGIWNQGAEMLVVEWIDRAMQEKETWMYGWMDGAWAKA